MDHWTRIEPVSRQLSVSCLELGSARRRGWLLWRGDRLLAWASRVSRTRPDRIPYDALARPTRSGRDADRSLGSVWGWRVARARVDALCGVQAMQESDRSRACALDACLRSFSLGGGVSHHAPLQTGVWPSTWNAKPAICLPLDRLQGMAYGWFVKSAPPRCGVTRSDELSTGPFSPCRRSGRGALGLWRSRPRLPRPNRDCP